MGLRLLAFDVESYLVPVPPSLKCQTPLKFASQTPVLFCWLTEEGFP